MARFDRRVEDAADRLRGHPGLDRLFHAASELGDFSLLWVMLGCLRALRSERDWPAAQRLWVGLVLESALVNGVVKSMFRRRRPPWDSGKRLQVRRPRTSSFPSGHATSSFTAAGLLAEGDPWWPLYYVLALVVAASRVYVKVHHASDVVAGAALGLALGRGIRRAVPLRPESPGSGRR